MRIRSRAGALSCFYSYMYTCYMSGKYTDILRMLPGTWFLMCQICSQNKYSAAALGTTVYMCKCHRKHTICWNKPTSQSLCMWMPLKVVVYFHFYLCAFARRFSLLPSRNSDPESQSSLLSLSSHTTVRALNLYCKNTSAFSFSRQLASNYACPRYYS